MTLAPTAKQLLEAGTSAVNLSGLAEWNKAQPYFVATANENAFEWYCSGLGGYGRWICWTLLSVGVENVTKAACVNKGMTPTVDLLPYPLPAEAGMPIPPPSPPEHMTLSASSIGAMCKIHRAKKPAPGLEKLDYGTLGSYWKKKVPCWLGSGSPSPHLSCDEMRFLLGGLRLLTEVVRNRDAHTYQPEQRRRNFYLVGPVFVPCLNLLLKTIDVSVRNELVVPSKADMIHGLANHVGVCGPSDHKQ